jgi:hypothetical protein
MEKRKEIENREENAQKRRRLLLQVGVPSSALLAPATFDSLNNDCLVNILSYLYSEDMNSIAICSKSCREARSNESLDQTRTGTIVCTQSATIRSIYNAIVRGGWNNAFSLHRTHLRIENVGIIKSESRLDMENVEKQSIRLEHVISLDLSCGSQALNRLARGDTVYSLFKLTPKVVEIDFSGLDISVSQVWRWFTHNRCPYVKRITWTKSENSLNLVGYPLMNYAVLTTLNLDDSCLFSPTSRFDLEAPHRNLYLFSYCKKLERLSIKGVTMSISFTNTQRVPLSQNMLIKMVRRHPTLKWLRSDLTNDNVAMLKQERPDIMFVSD